MNRRITKTMAEDAAAMMKKKAYGRKIENATAKVNAAVENLVRKYIPAPVIACVNEYSTYFGYTTGASITTTIEKNKCNLVVVSRVRIPSNRQAICSVVVTQDMQQTSHRRQTFCR